MKINTYRCTFQLKNERGQRIGRIMNVDIQAPSGYEATCLLVAQYAQGDKKRIWYSTPRPVSQSPNKSVAQGNVSSSHGGSKTDSVIGMFVTKLAIILLLACIPCALAMGILNKEMGLNLETPVLIILTLIVTLVLYLFLKRFPYGRTVYFSIGIIICVILLAGYLQETPPAWIIYMGDSLKVFLS